MTQEPVSTDDTAFRVAGDAALAALGEAFVLVRTPNSGGSRFEYLITSITQLDELVTSHPEGTSFSVFLEKELPLRGLGSEVFEQAAAMLEQAGQLLVAGILPDEPALEFSGVADDLGELHECFEDMANRYIGVGRYPPFWLPNGDECFTAYKPGPDGTIKPGAY